MHLFVVCNICRILWLQICLNFVIFNFRDKNNGQKYAVPELNDRREVTAASMSSDEPHPESANRVEASTPDSIQ
jgi:hypothetical protein